MKHKILIACEQSQVVCAAFRKLGFEAYSNDLLKCYGNHPEWHIIGDAQLVIKGCAAFHLQNGSTVEIESQWSLIIAHPPCTMLTHVSAVAFAKGLHTNEDIKHAASFFLSMLNAPCDLIAVENPAPMKIAGLPKYQQIIQPYNFGHPFSKRVCLWLKGLPPLIPTRGYYVKHEQWIKHCSGCSRRRAKTFEGIAEAMALQWGGLLNNI